jgi:enamine deaminase RidA (YjgF/YER057c/UK114 family)
MPTPSERLRELGLTLPTPASPVANYVAHARTGNLLFIAGQVSRDDDGKTLTGKLGETMSVEQGYAAARSAGLYAIAAMEAGAGGIDNVRRVVRMLGMVNCAPDFGEQPLVINGASDLFVEVFGDAGRHSRAAVGMASLPAGAAVEIEVICEVA